MRELAEILFFFHPATWWAGRNMEEAMEIACDRAAVTTEADAADYADRLYQILARVRRQRPVSTAGGLFATRTQIGRRIAALLQDAMHLRPRLSVLSTLSLVLLTGIAMSVGGEFSVGRVPGGFPGSYCDKSGKSRSVTTAGRRRTATISHSWTTIWIWRYLIWPAARSAR